LGTTAVSVLAMGSFVMWGFPIIGRWFFKRFDDSVSQYIFVLGMVFLAAFLSELAGVEPIIGAFLAGLALNKLVPHTSALMNRIEFVGNALFIPFFLIGVGMLIDYKVFYEDIETLKVAAVITIVATFAKYVAAWLAQKSFGYSVDERRLIFGLSNAHVAAALAVVLVGYNTIIGTDLSGEPVRLLNESVLNGSIVLIMVTCTVASFVAQKGARNIALNDNVNDTVDDSDIDEKILIAINDPAMSKELMDLSLTIKSKLNRNGLFALHVVENDMPNGQDEKRAQLILKFASETAASTDNYVHQLKRYDLNVVNGITSVIREQTITDLILGLNREKGISESFADNLTSGILSRCNATTLIYKPAQPLATIKRNLVVVPDKAEREIGFPFWLIKLWNVSKNTGSKLVFYGAPATLDLIKNIAQKHPVSIEFNAFTNWDDFLILGKDVKENDNLYIILSRKNHPSYTPSMNRIPYYLNNYFKEISFVLIFPMQAGIMESEGTDLKNPSVLEPIQDNLSMLDDIGKTITRLFKKRS
jgi:hypothetical protein